MLHKTGFMFIATLPQLFCVESAAGNVTSVLPKLVNDLWTCDVTAAVGNVVQKISNTVKVGPITHGSGVL